MLQFKKMLRDEKGYSLLELIVVLAIISLIIGIAGPLVLQQFGSAKTDAAEIAVNRILTDLEFYKVDVGSFPSEDEGLDALTAAPGDATGWNGPYIADAAMLIDPWGNEYLYTVNSDGTVTVRSLGADGAEDGTGENSDVSATR